MDTIQGHCVIFWTSLVSSTSNDSSFTATYRTSHNPPESDERDVLLVKQGQTLKLVRIDIPHLADQQNLAHIRSVQALDTTQKTCLERWPIDTDNNRESRESVQPARIDDIYIYIYSKVGDRSRGRREGSLFNSYCTEVQGRALLLPPDCSTLPLIHTL